MSESSNPTSTPNTTDNNPSPNMTINASSLATTSAASSALTGALNLASLQGAATDPGLLQQMLLLSQQVNSLKRSLDPSDAAATDPAAAGDENTPGRRLSMPFKKRHKSILGSTTNNIESSPTNSHGTNLLGTVASSLLGLGGGSASSSLLSTTVPNLRLTSPSPATAAASNSPTGTISHSSLASLTALLGKQLPDPSQVDMAARLEAFREARRRSNASRELLARLTKGGATAGDAASPTITSAPSASTPTLAAALNLDTIPLSSVSRRHSLASTLAGTCSRSGSLGALGRSSSIGLGAHRSGSLGLGAAHSAMASW